MNQEKKIYFASDVHLGAQALKDNLEREKVFANWLREIKKDACMLFLMGDIFDFWFEYKYVAPQGYIRTLGALADLCDNGVEVHYFIGNHDVWVFDYLPREIGLKVHLRPAVMTLFGRKFFLGHGDDPGKKDKGYQLLNGLFRNRFAQWLFAKIHPDLAFRFAHKWSKKSRLAKGYKGLDFKGEEKEDQIIFAKRYLQKDRSINYFVFGHRHIALQHPVSSTCELIILGDWFHENWTYGVFDGENFKLEYITKKYA